MKDTLKNRKWVIELPRGTRYNEIDWFKRDFEYALETTDVKDIIMTMDFKITDLRTGKVIKDFSTKKKKGKLRCRIFGHDFRTIRDEEDGRHINESDYCRKCGLSKEECK